MAGRVLVCGAWDRGPGYPRSESLLGALSRAGIEIEECRIEVPWSGAGKRRLLRSPWRWPGLCWTVSRSRRSLARMVSRAQERSRPDVILVPYPGHLLAPQVARVARVPVVLDLFLSAWDTAVEDRRLFAAGSIPARTMGWMDRRACAAVDLALVDTEDNARHLVQRTGLDADRVDWVPISDPDAPEAPAPYRPPSPDGALEVLFFGTGVPLHGLSFLVEAVGRTPGVRLTLVGGSAEDREVASGLPPGKVDLEPEFLTRCELQALLDRCHLVAGIFGTSGKVGRVVPYKVVHGLASGRPVLTAETPAVSRLLRVGEELLTCQAGDAVDLARVLARLVDDAGCLEQVAARARGAYERCFGLDALASRLCALLSERSGGAIRPWKAPQVPHDVAIEAGR